MSDAPPPTPRPRVICVDDDASMRRFVSLVLEDLPVEAVVCPDADSARAALRQGPAALVITDLMMPGESGFELLASLQADPALRGTAQLAVFSAGLNAAARTQLAGLAVSRELSKPVSVQALEDCVREALGWPGASAAPQGVPEPPAVTAPPRPDLSAEERAAVASGFAGDEALFCAFRDHARQQFATDRRQLQATLDAGDLAALRRLAHSLKGALATLGDARGRELALALEDAAAARDPDTCRRQAPALDRHLADISGFSDKSLDLKR